MSQSPITKFFNPSKSDSSFVQSKHRDSPRPATSAENLVCHSLKRLKIQPGSDNAEQVPSSVRHDEMLHKVPSPRRGRPSSYTFAEKMDALEQTFLHGFSATSRRLNIPCSTLSAWKKELVEGQGSLSMRSPLKGKRRSPPARKLTYRPEEDADELATWLSELRLKKKTVTYEQIRAKVSSKLGEEAFKAKSGWLSDFMNKHCVTLEPDTRRAIADTDKIMRDFISRRNPTVASSVTRSATSTYRVKQESEDHVDVVTSGGLRSELNTCEYFSSR